MLKQERLPGTEQELISDVIDAADRYEQIRNERQSLTKDEVAAHDSLLHQMHKHGLIEYRYENKIVRVVPASEKVKVSKAKDNGEEDADD